MNKIKTITYHHIKFQAIESTQSYLENEFNLERPTLVSTIVQSKGKGRGDNQWFHSENALAFSFTLKPSEILTLSSLEVALLIAEFIEDYAQKNQLPSPQVGLKWPNDIVQISEDGEFKKIGGILIKSKSQQLIVGVGINWGKLSFSADHSLESEYLIGNLFNQDLKENEIHQVSNELAHWIANHRLTSQEIKNKWNKLCLHLNEKIIISDKQFTVQGIFLGLGDQGQALIQNEEKILEVWNGSLRINKARR